MSTLRLLSMIRSLRLAHVLQQQQQHQQLSLLRLQAMLHQPICRAQPMIKMAMPLRPLSDWSKTEQNMNEQTGAGTKTTANTSNQQPQQQQPQQQQAGKNERTSGGEASRYDEESRSGPLHHQHRHRHGMRHRHERGGPVISNAFFGDRDLPGFRDSFFDDFFQASRGLNKIFNRLKSGFEPGRDFAFSGEREGKGLSDFMTMSVPVDVKESDSSIDFKFEVPGVKKENINIKVEDGCLCVEGTKERELKEEKDEYSFAERSYGRFERTIQLPDNVNEDSISAQLKDGILSIKLEKTTTQKKGKVVEIQS